MTHGLPGTDERRASGLPAAPFRVRAPLTNWVEPAWNVSVSPAPVVLVRLKKVLSPLIDWPLPLKTTVLSSDVRPPLSPQDQSPPSQIVRRVMSTPPAPSRLAKPR